VVCPLDAAAVKDGCTPLDKRRKEATLGVGAPRDQPPECLLRRQLVVHGRVVGAAALPGRAHFSPRPLNRGEREAASKAWSEVDAHRPPSGSGKKDVALRRRLRKV